MKMINEANLFIYLFMFRQPQVIAPPPASTIKFEPPTPLVKKETTPPPAPDPEPEEQKPAASETKTDTDEESDDCHIIPWRAQLRKTNSKLNILD